MVHPLPHISKARLREIVAAKWDVVAALQVGGSGMHRYDRYTFEAASRLWRGVSNDGVADYVVSVATEELEVDTGPAMRDGALILARAIRVYLKSLPQAQEASDGLSSSS
jgi:hypothetical protein